jgi:hypothetical protein
MDGEAGVYSMKNSEPKTFWISWRRMAEGRFGHYVPLRAFQTFAASAVHNQTRILYKTYYSLVMKFCDNTPEDFSRLGTDRCHNYRKTSPAQSLSGLEILQS